MWKRPRRRAASGHYDGDMETPLPFPDRRRSDRRHGDRRSAFRGGRRATDVVVAAALALAMHSAAEAAPATKSGKVGTLRTGRRVTDVVDVAAVPAPARKAGQVVELPPMKFGVDLASVDRAAKAGLPVSYGTYWMGGWTQKYGFGEMESRLKAAKKRGITPVVSWWYWGDDISPRAVESGVRDRYHGVQKDRATWTRLSREMADRIARHMGEAGAVVVLETEFNKNGIETWEPFDGYLAEQAAIFRSRGIQVALGFGNWGRANWGRFDRAIAAADYLGVQLLRSSVREPGAYGKAADTLLSAARALQRFGKPTLVIDVALSSYGNGYEQTQAAAWGEIMDRLPALKMAGVQGMLLRSIADDPKFDTANYHGPAERHWGLLRADGTAKPAFEKVRAAARAETGRATLAVAVPPGKVLARTTGS